MGCHSITCRATDNGGGSVNHRRVVGSGVTFSLVEGFEGVCRVFVVGDECG